MELTALKMVTGGDALARHPDGRAVMLSGALPGERVIARAVQSKRDFLRAATERVLEASPLRRDPPCPQVAAGCGGCDWQHVDGPAQLELKTATVLDALARTGRISGVTVRPAGAIAERGYRTTLCLAVDRAGRPGFRAAGAHRVVPTSGCLVAHPELTALLPGLALPGVRELVLRIGARTGERLALWTPVTRPRPAALPKDVACGPDAAVHEVVAGVRLRVSARSFFQSSPEAAELLVRAVSSAAEDPADWGDARRRSSALRWSTGSPSLPVW